MTEAKKQILILILSVVMSIASGFVAKVTGVTPSDADQIIFSSNIFIIFSLIDVVWLFSQRFIKEKDDFEAYEIKNRGDKELLNIRSSFLKIVKDSYGTKDLFVSYFMKELRRLEKEIRDVAEKKELRIIANHFLNVDNVLDAFAGDEEKVWRFAWPVSPDSQLFDELPWKRYFEIVERMITDKKIKTAKCILIIENLTDIESIRINALINYFKKHKMMDCRCVLAQKYKLICDDYKLSQSYLDFGIYGNRLLYLTEQSTPVSKGLFTTDINTVKSYISFFDTIWSSISISINPTTDVHRTVTIEELFEIDEIAPKTERTS